MCANNVPLLHCISTIPNTSRELHPALVVSITSLLTPLLHPEAIHTAMTSFMSVYLVLLALVATVSASPLVTTVSASPLVTSTVEPSIVAKLPISTGTPFAMPTLVARQDAWAPAPVWSPAPAPPAWSPAPVWTPSPVAPVWSPVASPPAWSAPALTPSTSPTPDKAVHTTSTAKGVGFFFVALAALAALISLVRWVVMRFKGAGIRNEGSPVTSTRPGLFARLFTHQGKVNANARDVEMADVNVADVSSQPRAFVTHSVVSLSAEPRSTAGPSWSGGFSGGFVGTHTVYAPRPDDPSRFTVVDPATTGQHDDGFVATHTAGTGSYPRPQ
jgi:hypothetical protein